MSRAGEVSPYLTWLANGERDRGEKVAPKRKRRKVDTSGSTKGKEIFKSVNFVGLKMFFKMSIYLQKSASIPPRPDPDEFAVRLGIASPILGSFLWLIQIGMSLDCKKYKHNP